MRLAPGQTVSHYRIIDVLGEGGMGIVYRAQDLKLPREVALKFLPEEFLKNADAKKRFVNEAKTASSLQHPNICTILDIDEMDDGQTFIVMPSYNGETLRARLNRAGRLSIAEATDFAAQLASGLARAHHKGIVHRDVKPENIFITENGTAILMDFGLAKLAGSTKLTRTGKTLGTYAYMSPEQATGAAIDGRSDIFSLGSVFYEMLTGFLPFKGEHEAAVLYGIVHTEPQPISAHRDDASPSVQAVVDKALKKDPNERYGNPLELRNDLARVTGAHVVETGRWDRLPAGKRVALVVSSVLVLVVLAGALTKNLWMPSKPVDAKDQALAIIGFHNLTDSNDEITTAGITELVNVGLIEGSPIRLISIEYLQDLRRRLFGSSAGAIADDQALEIARKAGATLLLAGSIGMKSGQPFVTWRLVEVSSGSNLAARTVEGADLAVAADQVVAGALPFLEKKSGTIDTTPPRPVAEMTTKNPEAFRRYLVGLQAWHEGKITQTISELEQAVSLDSTFALGWFELSRQRFFQDVGVEAALQKAWDLRLALGIKDRMRLEAWRLRFSGHPREEIDAYKELALRWPDDREILGDLFNSFFFHNYFAESREVARRGVSLYPDDVDFLVHLASAESFTGDHRKALRTYERAAALEPANPNNWDNVGLEYLMAGVPDSAETAFGKALGIDPSFLPSQLSLAYTAYCRGHVGDAIVRMEDILRTANLPRDLKALCQAGRNDMSLAFFYAESGRFDKALDVADDALRAFPLQKSWTATRVAQFKEALLLDRKDYKGAVSNNRQLRRYTPGTSTVILSRSRFDILLAVDSLTAGRREFQEVLFPDRLLGDRTVYQHAMYRKAQLLLREGQPDSALTYLREVNWGHYECPIDQQNIRYRHEYAHALQAAGRPEEAVAVLKELVRVCGGHALGHYELGKLYEDMKQPTEARKEYTTFLEMWSKADEGLPQLIDARKRLKALSG